jgi:hypothetical protein
VDPERQKTLALIEASVKHLSQAVRGAQLLQVAADYIDDGDLVYGRAVLARIETAYFEDDLPRQAAIDSLLASALALVVETFGADFATILYPRACA